MISNMRYLVTGGAGFIGSHVVDLLVNSGHEVVVIDNLITGRRENLNPAAELVEMDLLEAGPRLERALINVDGVFHLAALPRIQPSFERPIEHHRANVDATLMLMMAMKTASCKRLVISSSSSCYGSPIEYPTTESAQISPLNPYALQKYTSEQYAILLGKKYNIGVIALRYFNAYGPRSFNPANPDNAYSSVFGVFKYYKEAGMKIKVTGNGEQRRDFVHVFDIAMANLMAMESNIGSEILNVGTGITHTINSIAKLFTDSYDFIEARKGEAEITWANIEKIKRYINWAPTINVEEAVKNSLL